LSIILRGRQSESQNGIYRFAPIVILKIPLFPERNCNRLRALAIVALRGKIAVLFGNLGLNSGFKIGLPKLEVAGPNPVSRSSMRPLSAMDSGRKSLIDKTFAAVAILRVPAAPYRESRRY
jgi:hypothetical protein